MDHIPLTDASCELPGTSFQPPLLVARGSRGSWPAARGSRLAGMSALRINKPLVDALKEKGEGDFYRLWGLRDRGDRGRPSHRREPSTRPTASPATRQRP